LKPFTPPECPYGHVSPPIHRRRGFCQRVRDTDKLPRLPLPQSKPCFVSDRKPVYLKALELVVPRSVRHRRVASGEPRNCANPLFRINHTSAMVRDNILRLYTLEEALAWRGRLAN
jgi:hypothetical protein